MTLQEMHLNATIYIENGKENNVLEDTFMISLAVKEPEFEHDELKPLILSAQQWDELQAVILQKRVDTRLDINLTEGRLLALRDVIVEGFYHYGRDYPDCL